MCRTYSIDAAKDAKLTTDERGEPETVPRRRAFGGKAAGDLGPGQGCWIEPKQIVVDNWEFQG